VLKLADNPRMLPAGIASLGDLAGPWQIAHTKSRFEKAFAWISRQPASTISSNDSAHSLFRRTETHRAHACCSLRTFSSSAILKRAIAYWRRTVCASDRRCDQPSLTRELLTIEKAINGQLPLDPYPFVAIVSAYALRPVR